MAIAPTTVAGAMAVASQFKKNLIIKSKGSSDYKELPSSHYIHQRALRYNANTIVTYPKLPTQLLM